jgi:drug/metabolite transporter (DMT)-like permease
MLDVIYTSLIVSLLWGTSPVIHKMVLSNNIDVKVVMVVSGLFYFGCILAYWFLNANTIHNGMKRLTPLNIAGIAFTAIITGFVANILYLQALKKHHSYVVSALVYSSPVFTLILAYLLLKEQIMVMGASGVLCIVLGIILLALNER